MNPTDSNWGLSPRSDKALRLQSIRQNDPEAWDALIQSDLDMMKQPIFESPYDQYASIDDIPSDYITAHGQLLANLSGDDVNPNDIWALAEGDYTALVRLPEDKRDVAFRICEHLEESGNWKPDVIPPGFDPGYSYKISRINDGSLALSQGGHVFHTAKDYDGISDWLCENDPDWLPESGDRPPTGMTASQFFHKLNPADELLDENFLPQNPFNLVEDEEMTQEEIWEEENLEERREIRRELDREAFLNGDFDDYLISNPFEGSNDDDDGDGCGFTVIKFPSF
jgi:hypothetical protein